MIDRTPKCGVCRVNPDRRWPVHLNGVDVAACYQCFLRDRQNTSAHISSAFRPNATDAKHAEELLRLETTGEAILYLDRIQNELSTYAFWYFLGTLWVSYSGDSDLAVWRKLFDSGRPKRRKCLMKPFELEAFTALPERVRVFRAHRENETDWIAYTLRQHVAEGFALKRGARTVTEYEVSKASVRALFLRRNEAELIVTNRLAVQKIKVHEVTRT